MALHNVAVELEIKLIVPLSREERCAVGARTELKKHGTR